MFTFTPPPFWHNGPSPGNFYHFPSCTRNYDTDSFKQHSKAPITTATSLVALTFDNGVMIAGDTLGSYGSLARFRNCPRIYKVNDKIILGAAGDYGDFQYLKELIEQRKIEDECLDDGNVMKPRSLCCWLTRIMYNMRSQLNPFWNNLVIGGFEDGVPYLGTVDKMGSAYEDKIICTGYGAHIVMPSLRNALAINPKLNETEAKALVEKAMEILYYRDARSYPKYLISTINQQGTAVDGPFEVKQNWSIALRSH